MHNVNHPLCFRLPMASRVQCMRLVGCNSSNNMLNLNCPCPRGNKSQGEPHPRVSLHQSGCRLGWPQWTTECGSVNSIKVRKSSTRGSLLQVAIVINYDILYTHSRPAQMKQIDTRWLQLTNTRGLHNGKLSTQRISWEPGTVLQLCFQMATAIDLTCGSKYNLHWRHPLEIRVLRVY